MKRVLMAAVALAAGVGADGAGAAPLLAARATFDTPIVQFGDAIRTHITVVADSTQVHATSVRIVDDATPLTPLSTTYVTRATRGATLVIAITRTFSCISRDCVSAKGDATPALSPVTVTAVAESGRIVHATAAWPVIHVQGRVKAADLARDRPPFRANTSPPPPTYRLTPSTLAWLLDGVAVVLALAAGGLAVSVARRLARRVRSTPTAGKLERAVRLAHEAESRPPPDRRRALGLLARLLDNRDGRLSAAASDLAWARPDPERESVSTLVSDIEREVAP
jgi:hypothetical protein